MYLYYTGIYIFYLFECMQQWKGRYTHTNSIKTIDYIMCYIMHLICCVHIK